jgi:phage terminase small subunit
MDEQEIKDLNLTDKQERFFEEYIINLNSRDAGIKAGYSKKTVDQTASRLLSQVKFQQYIGHLKAEVSKRNEVSADYVVKKLKAWLELDVTKTIGLTVEELKELPLNVKDAITSIKHRTFTTEYGTDSTIEIKFASKEKAIEMLAKHIGFFDADNKITVEGVKMPDVVIGLTVYDDSDDVD